MTLGASKPAELLGREGCRAKSGGEIRSVYIKTLAVITNPGEEQGEHRFFITLGGFRIESFWCNSFRQILHGTPDSFEQEIYHLNKRLMGQLPVWQYIETEKLDKKKNQQKQPLCFLTPKSFMFCEPPS